MASYYQVLPDDNYSFQGDNVPVHRARITETLMDENEIKIMKWPLQSAGLNIIENVWLENEN